MNHSIKTLFINFSFRDKTDNFLPYGVLTIMTYLRKNGFNDTHFYNIDLMRPTREEAIEYIVDYAPDVLAISSPVSTGYESCKYYTLEIKKRLPDCTIILGGNLAVSAEIILKKTGVDFCFIGEGELSSLEFLKKFFPNKEKNSVRNIPGISFLDEKNKFIANGYGNAFPGTDIYDLDLDLINQDAIDHYFPKIKDLVPGTTDYKYLFSGTEHTKDNSSIDPDLKEKRIGQLLTSRGCTSRCTFCHRFVEGIRILPPETVISRMREMMDRYNVGAFFFSDECFGVSKKWLIEFCELVKELNVSWKVGGMRVASVTEEYIKMMRDAGCATIIYGMETGSQTILEIMEKKTTTEQGVKAMSWTAQEGIFTIVQLVLAMPGETVKTMMETEETLKRIGNCNVDFDASEISVNFTEALPGTPVYEYARFAGIIGSSFEEEERYLLDVSDTNAADWTLNFTNVPELLLRYWRARLSIVMLDSYIGKFGINKFHSNILKLNSSLDKIRYVFSRRGLRELFPNFVYRSRFILWLIALKRIVFDRGIVSGLKEIFRLGNYYFSPNSSKKQLPHVPGEKSLRKSLEKDMAWRYDKNPDAIPLRRGWNKSQLPT